MSFQVAMPPMRSRKMARSFLRTMCLRAVTEGTRAEVNCHLHHYRAEMPTPRRFCSFFLRQHKNHLVKHTLY